MVTGMNVIKKRCRIISIVLIASFVLTGCQTDVSIFNNYDVILPHDGQNAFGTKEQQLFSSNICVVPKKKQSEKDLFMTAGASLIFDNTDNKMLYADNIYQKMYPASTTKIVTALVALKYGNLDDVVTIGYNATHIT